MSIELLKHHVFDDWQAAGLKTTLRDIQHRVTPRYKLECDSLGKRLYPFLSENPGQKREFEKRFLECYKAYLNGDYIEIPDYDPKTGKHNKDHLCEACPNWQRLCQFNNNRLTISSG